MKKQVRPIPLETTKSLGAEIARIQSAQIRMKQANAALKLGDDKLLLSLGLPDDLLVELKQRFKRDGAGYPAYLLRNNRQVLRLLRAELQQASRECTMPMALEA